MKKFIIFCSFIFSCIFCFAVEVSNYNELKTAVIGNNDHIQLTQNIIFGNTPLVVSTNTALTSAGDYTFTIKGNNTTAPMLTFEGASSSISNIVFSSSTAAEPAVFVNIGSAGTGTNYSTFTIDSVEFSYNTSSTSTGGGALNIISAQDTYIGNVTFSTNSALGTGASGGALYYQGNIGFTGENINAYNNIAQQNGGAIYASTITLTGSEFSSNTATTGNGGAIYISSGTVQDSKFSYNIAQQNGGAIYASTITLTGSEFSSNTATAGNGGAIYITNSARMQNVSFFGNMAIAGKGGAIYNAGTTDISNGTFENNEAAKGGAIYNTGTMTVSGSAIKSNSSTSDGGAVYNTGTLTVTDTNFTQNNATGKGGAIYVESGTLNLNDSVNFKNNTAGDKGGAIYVESGTLNLNTNGKVVTFKDNTDSSGKNDIHLNGSSSLNINGNGTVNFYGGIKGGSVFSNDANINWYTTTGYDGNLTLNGGALNMIASSASAFNTVSLNSAKLNIQNGVIDSFSPSSLLSITGDIPLYIDVNLADNTVDTVNSVTGGGSFSINSADQLRILTDSSVVSNFNVTSATLNVNVNEDYYGPLYVYNLQQTSGGFNVIQTARLNPTVSALPVAANSKVIANVNTVNSLYNRIDVMLSREYLQYQDKSGMQNNPYVRMLEDEIANISGESLKDEWQKMVWFIPNAGYQKVNYGNDVQDVKNTFYGGLAGVDYPYWISDTSAFIPTIFMGYLGSSQKYNGTKLNNDSLAIGGMFTYMKNFAILSAQAYIANGTEKYSFRTYNGDFDVFSVTASLKGELNIKVSEDIVMQPALTAIYNLSNLQNYTTANNAHIQSTRFHTWLLTPSVKFMIDSDGWFPYAGISYNLSEKQKGDVTADNLNITKYKIKNFGEISFGMENNFFKNYSGYAQVSAYVGSSKGVAFQMGLRGYLN